MRSDMKFFNPMNWETLQHEYQLDGKRLSPWDGWNMPFGGAWCVVRSNTESLKHHHEEQELFIIVSGTAKIHVGEQIVEVKKGDFLAIPPGNDHFVCNDTDEDFHFFTMWWDQESCDAFTRNVDSHVNQK